MTSAVYERTPNLNLGLIEFNFPNWADDMNLNLQILDGAMSALGMSIKGAWANSTAYISGDLVADPDTGLLWRSQVNHTSSPTGTFAQDRVANPSYWVDASGTLHARGQWVPGTAYYPNDITYNGYTWVMATKAHTSSSSFDQDIADGKLVVIVDNEAAVSDSEAAASVAMNKADVATAAATTATTGATNANAAATAASNSNAAAASSATNASNSATAAAASAAQADYLYNHMLPDAPINGQYYGRRNETWQPVIAEAPSDSFVYGRRAGQWVPSATAVVADAPPTGSLASGQLWWESDTGNTYIWYDDGNSAQWIHVSGFAAYSMGAGGGIAEAPSDSHTYARRNTAWVDLGGAVPVNEAPMDSKQYVRKNGTWQEVVFPTPPTYPFVFDTNGDAVCKFGSSIVVRIKATGLILTKDDVEVFSVSV